MKLSRREAAQTEAEDIGPPSKHDVFDRGNEAGERFGAQYDPTLDPFIEYLKGTGSIVAQAEGVEAWEDIKEIAAEIPAFRLEAERADHRLEEAKRTSRKDAYRSMVEDLENEVEHRWAPIDGAGADVDHTEHEHTAERPAPADPGRRIRRGYPWQRRLDTNAYRGTLAFVSIGDGILNYTSFSAALRSEPAMAMLAALTTGLLIAVGSHVSGHGVREVESVDERKRSWAGPAAGFGLVGLTMGIFAVSTLRATGLGASAVALTLLQILFVVIAVLASWAHANPDADEHDRLDAHEDAELQIVEDAETDRDEAHAAYEDQVVALRHLLVELVALGETAMTHTENLIYLYLEGAQYGSGRQFALPTHIRVTEPDWLVDARQWLQTVGTWPGLEDAVDADGNDTVAGTLTSVPVRPSVDDDTLDITDGRADQDDQDDQDFQDDLTNEMVG